MNEPDPRASIPAPDSPPVDPERDLEQLRQILCARERGEIAHLREQIENPSVRAHHVGAVLPQAVLLSAGHGDRLAQALAPAVEATLHESVRRNPAVIGDAIFPVMGPAIRKAIADALARLVESLSQTLERTFTVQGLRWRLEALRTGRSFAEVVLVHTLVYRVEQLFLIHRESGLLLQHLQLPNIVAQDSDMVSGMLTAIQDFVRDSFRVEQGDQLRTMQVGDLSVWIESGPQALLAAVIRGQAPLALREAMQEAVEHIHRDQAAELAAFAGDAAPFALARLRLEPCLREQFGGESGRRRLSWKLLLAAAAAVAAVALWGGHELAERRRRADFLERIRTLEGVVVTEAVVRDGVLHLRGLRDPLAPDPAQLVAGAGLEPTAVSARWETYHALNEEFVHRRALRILQPPPMVTLQLRAGVLRAEGTAPPAWTEAARLRALLIPGIAEFNTDALRDETGDRLHARKRQVENTVLTFEDGTRLTAGQELRLEQVVAQINDLRRVAAQTGATVRLTLVGHTDKTGPEQYNARLSQERAETVHALMLRRGLEPVVVDLVGIGPREPLRPAMTEPEEVQNRRVSMRVTLESRPAGAP